MHNYLSQHPDIFLSDVKEPHHFSYEDDGWPNWAVKDRDAYEGLFAAARPGQERGEASTWTLYSQGAPRRISKVIPDARFIALLRNPTARAYSNWLFNLTGGFDPLDTFEAALEAERRRIENGSAWHLHYVAAGMYHDQVKRYIDTFGRDKVLILAFEDLRANALSLVQKTYDFLGVDPTFEADVLGVQNKTFVPRHPWLRSFSRSTGPVKKALKSLLPANASAYLGRRVKDYNRISPPKIDESTRLRLDDVFRDDAQKLSELTGKDFYGLWFSNPA